MSGFNALADGRYGQMIVHRFDEWVGRSFLEYGEFSESEVAVFRQVVRPGDWVLDIGANIGAHSIAFARIVGEDGRVLAFEPQWQTYLALCGNVAINSLRNVFPMRTAVGATGGSIFIPPLELDETCNAGGVELGGEEGEAISLICVDSLHLPRMDFMKIDVEGMELDVLKGAHKTIAKFRPVLYVECDRQEKSAPLIQFLASADYRMYLHSAPLFNPHNFAEKRVNVWMEEKGANFVSLDLLCFPAEAGAQIEGMEEVKP